ncbi:MAG: DUF58 domain-containing protein [Chloroflexi bacterium]|nr:DUF58 domain-containing protein [Chloroflexota bacterium]
MMTKTGFVFVITGVLVYLLASQTQIGWVYLFDAFIWSLLVLSAVTAGRSLKSLSAERHVLLSKSNQTQLNGPLEDETTEVKVTVTNSGRFTRHSIEALEHCPFAPPEKRHRNFLITRLEPGSTVSFYYETVCHKRGYYPSAAITLQVSDPLRLMVRKRSFELPLNLTVYPAYYRLEALPAADTALSEWGPLIKSSTAQELYGSREYQYGDPLKHIHWNNTARRGRFMLREFEQSRQGAITAVFDTRYELGSNKETTLEYSIRIAASLARLSTDSGWSTNIIAGERALYHAGWQDAMDYLARLEIEPDAGLELASAPDPGHITVAIISAKEVSLIPLLSKLATTGREVLVLLEGFAADEKPQEFSSRLRGDNIDIVSCISGNLEAGINRLGKSRFFGNKPASGV